MKYKDFIKAVSEQAYQSGHFFVVDALSKIVFTKKIRTMATNATNIFVNPNWIDTITIPQIIGVLCHELLHDMYGHSRATWAIYDNNSGISKSQWHELCNIAMDVIINDVVLRMGVELPKEGVFRKDLGISPALKTSHEIFNKLLKDVKDQRNQQAISKAVSVLASEQEDAEKVKNDLNQRASSNGFPKDSVDEEDDMEDGDVGQGIDDEDEDNSDEASGSPSSSSSDEDDTVDDDDDNGSSSGDDTADAEQQSKQEELEERAEELAKKEQELQEKEKELEKKKEELEKRKNNQDTEDEDDNDENDVNSEENNSELDEEEEELEKEAEELAKEREELQKAKEELQEQLDELEEDDEEEEDTQSSDDDSNSDLEDDSQDNDSETIEDLDEEEDANSQLDDDYSSDDGSDDSSSDSDTDLGSELDTNDSEAEDVEEDEVEDESSLDEIRSQLKDIVDTELTAALTQSVKAQNTFKPVLPPAQSWVDITFQYAGKYLSGIERSRTFQRPGRRPAFGFSDSDMSTPFKGVRTGDFKPRAWFYVDVSGSMYSGSSWSSPGIDRPNLIREELNRHLSVLKDTKSLVVPFADNLGLPIDVSMVIPYQHDEVGYGTEIYKVINHINENKNKYDIFVIITDCDTGFSADDIKGDRLVVIVTTNINRIYGDKERKGLKIIGVDHF